MRIGRCALLERGRGPRSRVTVTVTIPHPALGFHPWDMPVFGAHGVFLMAQSPGTAGACSAQGLSGCPRGSPPCAPPAPHLAPLNLPQGAPCSLAGAISQAPAGLFPHTAVRGVLTMPSRVPPYAPGYQGNGDIWRMQVPEGTVTRRSERQCLGLSWRVGSRGKFWTCPPDA